jgi:hypothetical protein
MRARGRPVSADPDRVRALIAHADEPHLSLDVFLAAIEADAQFADDLVRVANCPLFGMPGRVTRLKRAVLLLGPRACATIAAALRVRDSMKHDEALRALSVGLAAGALARELELPVEHEARLAGFLAESDSDVVTCLVAAAKGDADAAATLGLEPAEQSAIRDRAAQQTKELWQSLIAD